MPILSLASYHPGAFFSVIALSGIIILSLGIWALAGGRGDKERIAYFTLATILGVEMFLVALPIASIDPGVSRFWDALGWAVMCFVPGATLGFEAAHLHNVAMRRWVPYLYILGACLLAFIPSGLFVDQSRVVTYPWGTFAQATWGLYAYFLLFFGTMAVCIHMHWKKLHEPGLPPRQRKTYRLTFLAMLFGLSATLDFVEYFGIAFPPLSFITLTIWMSFYSAAILKYKLFLVTTEIVAPSVIETMPGALFVANLSGEILMTNPYASKLTGVASEMMHNRPIGEYLPIAAAVIANVAKKKVIGPLMNDEETTVRDADGKEHVVSLSASVVRGASWEPRAVTFIAANIEKLKEQLATIETQKRELQQAVAQMGVVQKAMVGRELKMVELKNELDALKSKDL